LEKGAQGTVSLLVKELNEKIENNSKENREVHKILLLMLLRSWAEKMSQTQIGSFEWDKIPYFSNKTTGM
jgi:hypothetical protein